MQRIAAVWHASPQKMVGVLFALLLAAAMAVGSGANFTSQSVNSGNLVAAGTLKAEGPSSAILNLTKIRPGESPTGEATISNTGNTRGLFTVTGSNLVDTPGSVGGPNLSGKVTLLVQELTGPGGTVVAGPAPYNGLLSNFNAAADLGNINGGASKTFRFTVNFPNGTPAEDNPYQGAQSTLKMTFDAVQS
jgi:spore coat-associated protein N